MLRSIRSLGLLALALGCGDEMPTAYQTSAPPPDRLFSVAGNSGCYTISGALDQAAMLPAPLAGTITGDVTGTVLTRSAGPAEAHGAAVLRPVSQTWNVTGGIVTPLIGKTLIFDNEFVGVFAQPPLVQVNTRVRIAEGAKMGNLTLHGITDLTAAPAVTSHLEYHGVICP